MRLILVIGATRTAEIPGISGAGATTDGRQHTPAADAEIIEYGGLVRAPILPVSPSGCPTPAVVTRAVRDLVGFQSLTLAAGLAGDTAAPTVRVAPEPGGDIRDPVPVPDAAGILRTARDLGRRLPDDEVMVAESIPGGTTTALGVLTALGEPYGVSSSLPTNPVALKREVVAEGLASSGLEPGAAAGDPGRAVGLMGDPVLAAISGLVLGATQSGTHVTLAGGTQMIAAAALVRHAGCEAGVGLATTVFVARDETADLHDAASGLDLELSVTDPGFDGQAHPALAAYARGEAKEGVGMGGALVLADRAGVGMRSVRDRTITVYEAIRTQHEP